MQPVVRDQSAGKIAALYEPRLFLEPTGRFVTKQPHLSFRGKKSATLEDLHGLQCFGIAYYLLGEHVPTNNRSASQAVSAPCYLGPKKCYHGWSATLDTG